MMKARIKDTVAGALLIFGIALLLGAVGWREIGAIGTGELIARVTIAAVMLFAGAVLSNEGEKE